MERSRPLQAIYPSFSVFRIILSYEGLHGPNDRTSDQDSRSQPVSILHSQNLLGTAPPTHPELGH
jgi:hypothetical protein